MKSAARSILRQIGHGASLDAGRIPDVFFRWYLDLQRHTPTMEHELAMLRRVIHPRGRFDPALTLTGDLLAKVSTPTIFVWGEDDAFGGEGAARRTVEAMPNAELGMLPDAGHLPWLDFPDRVASSVQDFLLVGATETR